ncbi:hypothetical protein [Niallia sp. FSL R7-0271]|uniref:hypothetical protein n=1 Tax=Niallia sp. FSL R7-0271 TaxID=2921678 RepID=UPI0030FAAE86
MLLKQLLFLSVLITAIISPLQETKDVKAGIEDTCERSDNEWKATLKNLHNKADIEALQLGDYKSMTDAMNGNEVWRFDLCTVNHYSYPAEMDAVDINGLTEDSVERIIFISFSESNIIRKSMYYKADDGSIRETVLFSDRMEKDLVLITN